MSKKYRTSEPDDKDVRALVKAIKELVDCEVRFLVFPDDDQHTKVICQVWRNIGGEKLGIATCPMMASEGAYSVTNRMYHSLLQCYWQVEGLAHAKMGAQQKATK